MTTGMAHLWINYFLILSENVSNPFSKVRKSRSEIENKINYLSLLYVKIDLG